MSSSVSRDPELRTRRPREVDHLRIDGRIPDAEDFDVELVKLPVPALLRPFVAEHRTELYSFGNASACSRLCSTNARTMLGVASGLSVTRSPPLSVNVYISF